MSDKPRRQMALTLFMLTFGYHTDAWRHPESRANEIGRISLIKEMVQAAERAKLHAVFFADSQDVTSVRAGGNRATGIHEPISSIGAMIGFTEKIGLLGTMSTTFSEPYNVARQFAGLDLLSDGRIGWNIVTSIMGNQNYGLPEMPDPELRYRRATEFVEVVKKLWESWEADAVIDDRKGGWWADPGKIHDIDHVGEFYRVEGALNMPRPPQGHPVLVQAGQSPAGVELGSAVADAIYTAQPLKDKSVEFYARFKKMVEQKGRDPEKVKILPGVMPIVGRTQSEAQEIADELAGYINPVHGRMMVDRMLDVDTSDLGLDDMIPGERLVDNPGRHERWRTLYSKMAAELTIREMIVELSRASGHRWVVGTPSSIADQLVEWFDDRACDGFNLNPPHVPVGMHAMLELLVPELQDRGYFQEDYQGETLRERMGLEIIDG